MDDDTLVHVSRPVTKSRPRGDHEASCGAERPYALVVAIRDSNCVRCWCHWYGDDEGKRNFEAHYGRTKCPTCGQETKGRP